MLGRNYVTESELTALAATTVRPKPIDQNLQLKTAATAAVLPEVKNFTYTPQLLSCGVFRFKLQLPFLVKVQCNSG